MQVVILAGGLGTRLSEETDFIPKPMVRIGNVPILRHIMNYYSNFGHTNFIIALGYKSEIIRSYFEDVFREEPSLSWKVELVDTGLETATGGRLKKLEDFLDTEFFMTYGDGLSNVDLHQLLDFHRGSGKIATLTAVKPPPRFGTIEISNGLVTNFSEKENLPEAAHHSYYPEYCTHQLNKSQDHLIRKRLNQQEPGLDRIQQKTIQHIYT